MNQRVEIFTEAGTQYGFGHLMRCIAIAEGFQFKGVLPVLYVRGDFEIEKKYSFNIISRDWLEVDSLSDLPVTSDNLAIVDSYCTNISDCNIFLKRYKKVLFLDDINRIPYPGGYVLNGVIGANEIEYPENKNITYLLGVEYQPLRRSFWDVDDYLIRENIENILITFGGSDTSNLTANYMQLARSIFPDSELKVVLGKGFDKANIKSIKNLKDSSISFFENIDGEQFVQLMRECDLAISAAGQTISELVRVGIPTFAVMVDESQKFVFKFWEETGVLFSGKLKEQEFNIDNRRIKSQSGKNLIDGQGVKRIVQFLLEN